MAMYYCHHCDSYVDDDWHPGEEDPENPLELICPSCLSEREPEAHSDPFEEHTWTQICMGVCRKPLKQQPLPMEQDNE